MGTSDAQTLKSEAGILARQARPQRSSTWMPRKRDWRYATGVIQHDDWDDAPKSRSVWDTLDYDYQAGRDNEGHISTGSTADSGTGSVQDVVLKIEAAYTPESTDSKMSMVSPKAPSPAKPGYKSMSLRKGSWKQVTRFTSILKVEGDGREVRYVLTGRVVRLRFTSRNKTLLQDILQRPVIPISTPSSFNHGRSPVASQNLTPPVSSPNTPATARTAATIHTPHVLDSIESLYNFPLFKRAWVDETYNFDSNAVRKQLRDAGTVVDDLGSNFAWYTDAVPIDAILPPGVPISAKEIHAFYPHHVRWKGVMLRLTHNDYRGPDIMGMQALFRGAPNFPTSPAHMNNFQRDIVKTNIRGFKTGTMNGRGDRNLRTSHLVSGPHIESMRKGYTLPTFEDLVRGLHRLPSGLDARGLTQCLAWYLDMRHTFTPRLDLNVLHAQSLIRALRQPIKPFGPQNLDRNALEEWRHQGTFESVVIETRARGEKVVSEKVETLRRSRLHLNLDDDDVEMHLKTPVRNILTFPFLALHGVVAQALRLGIEKAEMRGAARKGCTGKKELEAKWAARTTEAGDVDAEGEDDDDLPEPTKPYRIPKRTRPVQTEDLLASKKSASRTLAPARSREHDTTQVDGTWYMPVQQQAQGGVYGRREYDGRREYAADLRRVGEREREQYGTRYSSEYEYGGY